MSGARKECQGQIRPIEDRDLPTLLAMFQEFATFQGQPDKMKNSLANMQRDRAFLQGFVATIEPELVVGYATMFFCYYTWSGKALYLDDLYVDAKFRGQGFGTALIERVIQFARDHQCQQVRWQVSKWNAPAIAFYQSLGAKIDDIEQNCSIRFEQ